jgi:imidazoleglycerol-phosphate dehydratase
LSQRSSILNRETAETRVSVELDLDGQGSYEIDTGNGMFDHMLAQLSRHGAMDLKVSAQGDVEVGWHHLVEDVGIVLGRAMREAVGDAQGDVEVGWHHLVEDVGIVLGRAMREAVGDARGITRMSHAYVPLDEALALAVVDFSGRGYAVIDSMLTESDLGGLSGSLIDHFLESFSREGAFNLHLRVLAGSNNHHKAEAAFKALARAVKAALTIDESRGGAIPSTKGKIG